MILVSDLVSCFYGPYCNSYFDISGCHDHSAHPWFCVNDEWKARALILVRGHVLITALINIIIAITATLLRLREAKKTLCHDDPKKNEYLFQLRHLRVVQFSAVDISIFWTLLKCQLSLLS